MENIFQIKNIIIASVVFFIVIFLMKFLLKFFRKDISDVSVIMAEAKNVLKYISTEAYVSVLILYEEKTGVFREDIKYYQKIKRKVLIIHELEKVLIKKDIENKKLILSHIPEPEIHIGDNNIDFEEKEIKKGGVLGIFGNKIDDGLKKKIERYGVELLKENANNSSLKKIAIEHFKAKINVLNNSADKIGWTVESETPLKTLN